MQRLLQSAVDPAVRMALIPRWEWSVSFAERTELEAYRIIL